VNQWHYEWQIGVKTANDALIIAEYKIGFLNHKHQGKFHRNI